VGLLDVCKFGALPEQIIDLLTRHTGTLARRKQEHRAVTIAAFSQPRGEHVDLVGAKQFNGVLRLLTTAASDLATTNIFKRQPGDLGRAQRVPVAERKHASLARTVLGSDR